jgi:hypothetical protein
MTKQRNAPGDVISGKAGIQAEADHLLDVIARAHVNRDSLMAEKNAALSALHNTYDAKTAPFEAAILASHSELMKLMKTSRGVLFDGTDVVHLPNGSLIHSVADKVSIPRDALAKCEELGFAEVVKIAKSLDRDAVEKWPDERLILIGAERKQKEEFSYDLAAVKA